MLGSRVVGMIGLRVALVQRCRVALLSRSHSTVTATRSNDVLLLNSTTLDASTREVAAPEKPPLVVLHGLFGNLRNWRSISIKLLRQGVVGSVVAMDLRNHGGSPRHPDCSIQSMTRDLAHTMRHLGLPASTTVLGHSMGGKIAMNLAIQHPELFAKMIIADVAPVKRDTRAEFTPFIRAMRALNLTPENPQNHLQHLSRDDLEQGLKKDIPSEGVRQFLLSNLVTTNKQWAWAMDLDAIEVWLDDIGFMPEEMASKSSMKEAVFIMGERSSYGDPSNNPIIHKYFPAAEIRVLKNAGHWLHAEQPDAFIAEVTRFLGK